MRKPLALLTCSLAVLAGLGAGCAGDSSKEVVLWHSYRGAEQEALDQLVSEYNKEHPEANVRSLSVAYKSFPSKLTNAIPRDHGPDVFIYAHERIGGWARSELILPLGDHVTEQELGEFLPETLLPLEYDEKLYGLPLAFKCLALFYNKALIDEPPRTTDELVEELRRLSGPDRYGLAYFGENFYFHAPWLFGFGGELFPKGGGSGLDSPEAIAALSFAKSLQDQDLVPHETSPALVTQLFNSGKVAMTINGLWFTGEIEGVDYGVAPLPTVSATGLPARPFLTDEAVFVSSRSKNKNGALTFARFMAGPRGALVRATVGGQVVAHKAPWLDPRVANDPILTVFRAQLPNTVPMDNHPRMLNIWEPAEVGLNKLLRQNETPEAAAQASARRFAAISPPVPPAANPTGYIGLLIALLLAVVGLLLRWFLRLRRSGEGKAAAQGWRWIAPAITGTTVLLLVPFCVGLALSLFAHRNGDWTFVGMANFLDILAAKTYGPTEPLSFYFALAVTIMWTAINVVLHLGLGLGLALILRKPALRLRPVYRVLLIVPWAVPNYITALIWKGLFQRQYGAINAMLEGLGIDGIAWFSSFWGAFFANVCTNSWLGFPFMMVVCLGALQSIPQDLYEAADVDGASAWDKFRHITVPLLRPALIPALLLGTVWTFNQFNIVYLVSGGEPGNSTEILITEAWRWAFARQEQYGYAAAYAALIFVILLLWSSVALRISRRVEAEQ